jgi:hypothetical protein
MRLWWLSFRGGTAVIMQAETLAHARLLAAVEELRRASLFDNGFPVDPEFEGIIPEEFIGRSLSRNEASDLLRLLKDGEGAAQSQNRMIADYLCNQLRWERVDAGDDAKPGERPNPAANRPARLLPYPAASLGVGAP